MPLGPSVAASRRFPRWGNAIPRRSLERSVWTTRFHLPASGRQLSMGDLPGFPGASGGAGLLSPPSPDLLDSRQCYLSHQAGSLSLVPSEPPLCEGVPASALLAGTECDRTHLELHAQVRHSQSVL